MDMMMAGAEEPATWSGFRRPFSMANTMFAVGTQLSAVSIEGTCPVFPFLSFVPSHFFTLSLSLFSHSHTLSHSLTHFLSFFLSLSQMKMVDESRVIKEGHEPMSMKVDTRFRLSIRNR